MDRWTQRVRWPLAAALLYGALSALCFAVPSSEVLLWLLDRCPKCLWLLGPPALLIHGFGYGLLYALCTVVVAGLVWGGVFCFRRSSDFYMVFFLLAIVVWCVSGFVTYAPGA